jgi:urease accessory protein
LLEERLRIGGGAGLDGPAGLRGFPVCASLIAAGATMETLALARRRLDVAPGFPVGATLVEDLLLIRALAPEVEPVTRLFRALWSDLRPAMFGIAAAPPRIWAT